MEQSLLYSQIPAVDRIRRCDYCLLPLGGNIYSSLLRTEHQEKEVDEWPRMPRGGVEI